ncbi:dihydroorotase [Compostimonas suwonensis]|uniref:Dihydropyrimidinase n=1 Tax=Compostimonas suwonensis TaxID=1048394 RepID=A0A2M9C4G5_9MICO|nr:amidohydrolase family protein [Compostimonas suwonensis]PJJ65357.1 dihydropyrimidinase [Compostimonas suwonensis]
MTALDLAIVGGTIVDPVLGRFEGTVGIADGRIALLAEPGRTVDARRTLDAAGRLVLPGIIDPHVHFGVKAPFEGEVESETRAALLGGVTTAGIYLRQAASYLPDLPHIVETVETRSSIDLFAHATIVTAQHVEEIGRYAREWGITSFKAYLMGDFIENIPDDRLVAAMREVAALGGSGVMAIHAENPELVQTATDAADRSGNSLRDWHLARPDLAEAEAVNRVAFFSRATGARVYIVHLTSADGLESVRAARAAGTDIVAETTTMALTLDEENPVQVLNKRYPPLRAPQDREALWRGLIDGEIDTVGTDNVTSTRAENRADGSIWDAGGGFSALSTHFPALFTESLDRGVPVEQWLRHLTADVAKTYGLYPRKGSLQLSADADVLVVDPVTRRAPDMAASPARGDWSPYDDRELTGWPVAVVRAGELVVDDGRLVSETPAGGHYLRRTPPSSE